MMTFRNFEDLSHSDIAAASKADTVVLVPIGPLEEHGPHLPVGVDPILARFFSEEICRRLQSKLSEKTFMIYPTLWAGCHTLKYRGSVEIPQRVVYDLLYNTAKKLAQDGFRKIIAVSAHGGPKHIVAIEEVAARISWRYRHTTMVGATGPVLTKVVFGKLHSKIIERLKFYDVEPGTDLVEALKTDYHAGMIETSLMMLARPELVKPTYKELGPAIVDRPWKITRSSGLRVGGGLGHLGSPAFASEALGKALVDVLFDEVEADLVDFIKTEKPKTKRFRSPLYYIPIFKTYFRYVLLSGLSVVVFLMVMTYFMRMLTELSGGR
jgi:creatinine amidohydrolase